MVTGNYRFTCKPKHDESLAGQPASIYSCNADEDTYILRFDDGSRLEIPIRELVRLPWDREHDRKDGL